MATKTKAAKAAKATKAAKQTTLTEDLRDILATLNKFRRKHRLVHIQVNSTDTAWVEKNHVPTPEAEKCAVMSCPTCNTDCPHDIGDESGYCDCECTCDDCECECDDCSYCDKCQGRRAREEATGFQSYWKEHTGTADLYKKVEPILVAMNQMDADNVWSGAGEFPKDVCHIIGEDITDELAEQAAFVEACIADRVEAETNMAQTRAAIERLSLLHTASEQTAEELGLEQGGYDPSIERFKRLDLD